MKTPGINEPRASHIGHEETLVKVPTDIISTQLITRHHSKWSRSFVLFGYLAASQAVDLFTSWGLQMCMGYDRSCPTVDRRNALGEVGIDSCTERDPSTDFVCPYERSGKVENPRNDQMGSNAEPNITSGRGSLLRRKLSVVLTSKPLSNPGSSIVQENVNVKYVYKGQARAREVDRRAGLRTLEMYWRLQHPLSALVT